MAEHILFFKDPFCHRQTEVLQLCFNIISALQCLLPSLLPSLLTPLLEHVDVRHAASGLEPAGARLRPEEAVWPEEKGRLAAMETVAT